MTDNEVGPFTRLVEAAREMMQPYGNHPALRMLYVPEYCYEALRDALAAVEGFTEWGDERSEGPYMNVPGGFRNQRSRWLASTPWRRPDGSIFKISIADEKRRMSTPWGEEPTT